MDYVCSILFQMISIDRHMSNIAMSNRLFSCQTFRILIKRAIAIYAVFSIFKKSVAYNIFRVIMTMHVNQRNYFAIIILKGIFSDCTAVGTLNVIFCGPTTEIVSFCHFDFFLLILLLTSIFIFWRKIEWLFFSVNVISSHYWLLTFCNV